jgi:hypothetical protein
LLKPAVNRGPAAVERGSSVRGQKGLHRNCYGRRAHKLCSFLQIALGLSFIMSAIRYRVSNVMNCDG